MYCTKFTRIIDSDMILLAIFKVDNSTTPLRACSQILFSQKIQNKINKYKSLAHRPIIPRNSKLLGWTILFVCLSTFVHQKSSISEEW
jgi:hypothetical protein